MGAMARKLASSRTGRRTLVTGGKRAQRDAERHRKLEERHEQFTARSQSSSTGRVGAPC
jgi:hypothetical protein